MLYRPDLVDEMHQMCFNELKNVRNYVDAILSVFHNNLIVLQDRDAHIATLKNISHLSRKFITQLAIDLNLTENRLSSTFKEFVPRVTIEEDKGVQIKDIKASPSEEIYNNTCSTGLSVQAESKSERDNMKIHVDTEFSKYTSGYIFKASVTFIKHVERLNFYAFDHHSPDMKYVKKLASSSHMRQFTGLPPKNKVFGLVLEEKIFRALLHSIGDTTDSSGSYAAKLIDFGEVVDVDLSYITYRLTPEQERIPPQALFCHLHSIEGYNQLPPSGLQAILEKLSKETCTFEVVSAYNDSLDLKLLQLLDENASLEPFNNEPNAAKAWEKVCTNPLFSENQRLEALKLSSSVTVPPGFNWKENRISSIVKKFVSKVTIEEDKGVQIKDIKASPSEEIYNNTCSTGLSVQAVSKSERNNMKTHVDTEFSKYTSGYIFKASVTFIKHVERLNFYAFDHHSPDMKYVKKLASSSHMRQFTGLPPKNKVFGLVLEEKIFRALLHSIGDTTDSSGSYAAKLIDFGEVVDVDLSYITYRLTPEQERIPPQALFCHLHSIEGYNQLPPSGLQAILEKLSKETCTFEVVSAYNDSLDLKLLQLLDENASLEPFNNEEPNAAKAWEKVCTNPFFSEDQRLEALKLPSSVTVPPGFNWKENRLSSIVKEFVSKVTIEEDKGVKIKDIKASPSEEIYNNTCSTGLSVQAVSKSERNNMKTHVDTEFSKFTSGYILKASVTFIKDVERLNFYAFDHHSPDMQYVKKLASSSHMRQFTGLPPKNKVFGLVLEEKIFRALLHSIGDTTDSSGSYAAKLIDFGEVVDVDLSYITYRLTPEQERIPPQALFCHLHSIEGYNQLPPSGLQAILENLSKETCTFEVVSAYNDSLDLKLLQLLDENASLEPFNNEEPNAAKAWEKVCTNPFFSEDQRLEALKLPSSVTVPPGFNWKENRLSSIVKEFVSKVTIEEDKGVQIKDIKASPSEEIYNNTCSTGLSVQAVSKSERNNMKTHVDTEFSKFTSGYILKASVTFIKDVERLNFYAFDHHSPDMQYVKKLASSSHMRQFTGLPPKNKVFGLVLEEKIFRALLRTTGDTTDSSGSYAAKLIDFGEVVDVDLSYITYRLTPEQERIPPQALFCHLHSIEGHNQLPPSGLQAILEKLSKETCTFEVVSAYNDSLDLKLLQLLDENAPLEPSNNKEQNATKAWNEKLTDMKAKPEEVCTNPFLSEDQRLKPLKLSSSFTVPPGSRPLHVVTTEELEMLYEEPECTSNALKAVYGYDPKDEQRLCHFTNEKTGGCFKGSRCRKEHVPLDPMGITKDTAPIASRIYERYPSVHYSPGEILTITPTYISQIDRFYAQVNDPKAPLEPLIWSDKDLPQYKHLQHMPMLHDLVLAKYVDGFWYRAMVIQAEWGTKEVEVFFVDYGNKQIVPLAHCARCDPDAAHLPFHAEQFRICDVCDSTTTKKELTFSITMIRQNILNKTVKVKVMSHHEDIFIRFLDNDMKATLESLEEKGYLKPCKTILI